MSTLFLGRLEIWNREEKKIENQSDKYNRKERKD